MSQTSIGPIHWGSYPGEMLEVVMAVLVAQEIPDIIRRTPSSGDGGIDLIDPTSEEGVVVYQVKGFVGRLGDSQRKQIAKSFRTASTESRIDEKILAMHFVVPIDPTSGEEKWFKELVKDSKFPCTWRGQVYWNSMASKHQHVLDYYFSGGRERINTRLRAVSAMLNDVTRPPQPAAIGQNIQLILDSMNREDPHYEYDLLMTKVRPPRNQQSGYAFAETRQIGGRFLTIGVIPKHGYSLEDSPIRGTLTIKTDADTHPDLVQSFRDFENFGRAFDIPEGALTIDIEAPGGLGGLFEGQGGWIGPSLTDSPALELKIKVIDEHSNELATVKLAPTMTTRGPLGGVESTFADADGGVLTVRLSLTPPIEDRGTANITFSSDPIVGHPVVKIIDVARFLAHLQHPNVILVGPRYGEGEYLRFELPSTIEPSIEQGYLEHLEDLNYIQKFSATMIPLDDDVTYEFANHLHRLVRMLKGEVITGTWDTIDVVTSEDAPPEFAEAFDGTGSVAIQRNEWIFFDNGLEVDLGPFVTVLASTVAAPGTKMVGNKLRLVPGKDRGVILRAGEIESLAQDV